MRQTCHRPCCRPWLSSSLVMTSDADYGIYNALRLALQDHRAVARDTFISSLDVLELCNQAHHHPAIAPSRDRQNGRRRRSLDVRPVFRPRGARLGALRPRLPLHFLPDRHKIPRLVLYLRGRRRGLRGRRVRAAVLFDQGTYPGGTYSVSFFSFT